MITRFPTIRLEGGLISSDQIDRIADQKVKEFSIDDIAAAWSDIRSYWTLFQNSLAKLPENDLGTSITRNRWMMPFFSTLGYDLSSPKIAAEVDGQTYAISHRAGKDDNSPPIHIVGIRQSLDRRPESGRPRLAPHSLVQEYLNRTEHLWGIVTNGSSLRILRDSHLMRKQAYIEFDLEQMMKDELFADFALLFRLIHASRLPKSDEDASTCLLEQYHKQTVEQGGRVRDHLRDGVEKALIQFANGFLSHPRNSKLRANVQDKSLEPFEYYQQLLRLIYRFLFLMVSEERNLITENLSYREHYSISRIRRLAEVRAAYTKQEDLWLGLATIFKLFQDESLGPLLSVPTLNGDLFDPARTAEINDISLTNRDLLTAMWDICMYREKENAPWRRINYAALDVEELGSVYESLLDFQPVFVEKNGKPEFQLLTGTERKSTGSYYTPPELVNELIQSALAPTIKDRLAGAKTGEEKSVALLELSVCDPACGSGHFLLAAARTIGRELAKARTGDEEPAPEQMRIAIRDAITHCIYGVDKNPLAVDLCKVALWLEGHTKAKPLTFLDHRIRCGDSLVGVFDLNVLNIGIPDEAFNPISSDDKEIARKKIKALNKKSRLNQRLTDFDPAVSSLSESRRPLLDIPDNTPEQIRQKASLYHSIQEEGTHWCKDKTACDIWTAGFFIGLTKENDQKHLILTTETLRAYLAGEIDSVSVSIQIARKLSKKYRFFHWKLEFPEVFERGGFDCILGNPPWEKVQPEERKFFSNINYTISNEKNSSKREKLIQSLFLTNPDIKNAWNSYKNEIESRSKFISSSDRFLISAKGNLNLYKIFTDLSLHLLSKRGFSGLIVQSGIVTDDLSKEFFEEMMVKNQIISLFDFINTEKIFDIDSRMKFSLITLKKTQSYIPPKFGFFFTKVNDIYNQSRTLEITYDDIKTINPNTKNCPMVQSVDDLKLLKKIHSNSAILYDESNSNNPFQVKLFGEMFNMTRSSKFTQKDTEFYSEKVIPLYESKLFYQYDHRFATFENATDIQIKNGVAKELSSLEKSNPQKVIITRYFVKSSEFEVIIVRKNIESKWFLGVRGIASATNEKTCISSLIPFKGIADSINLILINNAKSAGLILANLNTIICDFVSRKKVGNQNLNLYIIKQLPIVPMSKIQTFMIKDQFSEEYILKRVIELTYTAWDLESFAQDILKEIGTDTWDRWFPKNQIVNGNPQPFIWNEERRAILRAEIDACYAKLYGLNREELECILSTFPVLQKNEERDYREYRTRRLVLEAWDKMDDNIKRPGV